MNKNPKKSKESYEKRFNKLESLIANLIKKQSDPVSDQEQITNKLDNLERLIEKQKYAVIPSTDSDEPRIEELEDRFIPEIDVEGMSLKGDSGKIIIEKEESIDEAADLLSSIKKGDK